MTQISTKNMPDSQLFTLLPAELIAAVNQIEQANNWQDKYRQIMLLGKQLPVDLIKCLRLDGVHWLH